MDDKIGDTYNMHWEQSNGCKYLVEHPEGRKPLGIFNADRKN
jgi:hypothetical protein